MKSRGRGRAGADKPQRMNSPRPARPLNSPSAQTGSPRDSGILVYDTIATAVWSSLRACGVDPARVRGWGRLFREVK